jgi:hypothetical protein
MRVGVMTLRNTVIAFFLILTAIVVTKTGRGDTPRTTSGTGGGRVVCSVSPQRPVEKDGRLLAGASFRCDSPGPDRLTVRIYLERNDNGRWVTVAKDGFVSSAAQTTREQSAAARTRQIGAACAEGTFRTRVEGTLVDAGRTTQIAAETSGERRSPC